MKASLKSLIKTLATNGALILSTSTGLYNLGHINRLQEIYRMADGWDGLDGFMT